MAAFLQAVVEQPEGFGALTSSVDAQAFRGGRIRLVAFLRPEAVEGWAGLYVSVHGLDPARPPLSFENTHDRPVTGTGV
jgi:hypothetical protein